MITRRVVIKNDDDKEDEETYDDEDDDDDDFHLKTGESGDSNSLVGPDDRLLGGDHISSSGHIGDCKEASAAKIDLIHPCSHNLCQNYRLNPHNPHNPNDNCDHTWHHSRGSWGRPLQ